jgi:hypothetical protein
MHYRGVRGEPMVAIGSIVLVFEDSDISLTAILRASANSARVNWRPADVVAFDSRQAFSRLERHASAQLGTQVSITDLEIIPGSIRAKAWSMVPVAFIVGVLQGALGNVAGVQLEQLLSRNETKARAEQVYQSQVCDRITKSTEIVITEAFDEKEYKPRRIIITFDSVEEACRRVAQRRS